MLHCKANVQYGVAAQRSSFACQNSNPNLQCCGSGSAWIRIYLAVLDLHVLRMKIRHQNLQINGALQKAFVPS